MSRMIAWVSMLCLLLGVAASAAAGNYVLTIDGKPFAVDLDTETTVELSDGRRLRVGLQRSAIATFRGDGFSFRHPGHLLPSRTDLGGGIWQTAIMTPLGTLVLVQEYTTIDPGALVDLMVRELTKEEVEYGYELDVTDTEQTLQDGTRLTGKRAVTSYRSSQYSRRVLAHSGRDSGILIVTQIEKDDHETDAILLETFWKSLRLDERSNNK